MLNAISENISKLTLRKGSSSGESGVCMHFEFLIEPCDEWCLTIVVNFLFLFYFWLIKFNEKYLRNLKTIQYDSRRHTLYIFFYILLFFCVVSMQLY